MSFYIRRLTHVGLTTNGNHRLTLEVAADSFSVAEIHQEIEKLLRQAEPPLPRFYAMLYGTRVQVDLATEVKDRIRVRDFLRANTQKNDYIEYQTPGNEFECHVLEGVLQGQKIKVPALIIEWESNHGQS